MNVTEELLKTIYERCMQYCYAKFGEEPDEIKLLEDGSFEAVWHKYARGNYTEEEYFKAEELTRDLDEVYAERKSEQAVKAQEYKEQREKQKRIQDKRDKEERKNKFEQLKKEFEPSKTS